MNEKCRIEKVKINFSKIHAAERLIIIEGSDAKVMLTWPGSITESIAASRSRYIIKMRCIHGMMHILARR